VQVSFRSIQLRHAFERAGNGYRLWGRQVGDRYIQRVRYILDANSVQELYRIQSLHLHPLSGPLDGFHAMTLIGRWRLVLTIGSDIVTIEEVTNHCGD